MYHVTVAPEAADETLQIYHYIRHRSPLNAERWYEGLEAAVRGLADMPTAYPVVQESESLGQEVRQRIYGNYRILFAIEGNTVRVLHIRHGARRRL